MERGLPKHVRGKTGMFTGGLSEWACSARVPVRGDEQSLSESLGLASSVLPPTKGSLHFVTPPFAMREKNSPSKQIHSEPFL